MGEIGRRPLHETGKGVSRYDRKRFMRMADERVMRRSARREMILLTLGVLVLCGLCFGKAFHMDDPLVVWTAQRIAVHPADFYGFNVNWYGFYAPMTQVYLNPPGAAYYAAIFGAFLGWSEPVMHGAMALMGAALLLGVYLLARQLGGKPMVAGVLALVSPGVLVSMSTVMTDLVASTLWVWAVLLWIRGLDERYPTANGVSGALVGLAALTKYFAISLVPLLLVYTLLSGRRRWPRAVWLMLPMVMVGLFDLYTRHLYGVGLFLQSFGVVKGYHEQYALDAGRKIMTALAFLGAGAAPALFIAPWLWGRLGRIVLGAGGAGIAALTLILARSGWQVGEPQTVYSWWFWPQYGLWVLAGICIIALALADLWSRRDRDSVLLVLWLGGTIFFGVFLYHFVNIRVILPALPTVALLCARRMSAQEKLGAPVLRRAIWLASAAGLILSLCILHADMTLANSARAAAEHIAPEKRAGRTWFSGHWGFQHYMERRSAKPLDMRHADFRLGDAVVTPVNASNRILTRPHVATTDESFEIPVCSWLTTMRAECGAGFYADLWGPLPFVFGPVPAERYDVTVLGRR